jgi:REP element-mobilizing transposase RayT
MNSDSLQPGEFYHIFSRTIGSELLFRSDENYSFFLKKYLKHCGEQFLTFAYCLLPNHFHFLVQVKENTTSEQALSSISNFLNSYSKAYNKLYERHGGLFQRKFKRKQIAKDSYLSQVMIYIHQNPQNHGIIEDFQKWKYSSYQALISSKATHLERKCSRLVWGIRSISRKSSIND